MLSLLFALWSVDVIQGFVVQPSSITPAIIRKSPFELSARPKKRRRRKEPLVEENDSSSDIMEGSIGGDLPEFDLGEDGDSSSAVDSPKPKRMAPASSIVGDPLQASVSANMMGSADKPTKSVGQLLNDRSLESKLEFDDPEDDSLPDLLAMAKQKQQEPAIGKKRARREARVAQAMASGGEAEDEESLLSKLPLDITDDKGKIAPIKILETGTWLGIFLLVAWEIYINSPLFDRAAPMAPVVY